MTTRNNAQIRGTTLLVLDVQNQYKDIAHIIEKKMKKYFTMQELILFTHQILVNKKKIF